MEDVQRVVRPVLIYGADNWSMTRAQDKKLEVAEVKLLRGLRKRPKRNQLKNDEIR